MGRQSTRFEIAPSKAILSRAKRNKI